VSVVEPRLDGGLCRLNAATKDLARVAADPSIRARLAEIADEVLELARSDSSIWLNATADHRGEGTE
jgi:hypothetical protein